MTEMQKRQTCTTLGRSAAWRSWYGFCSSAMSGFASSTCAVAHKCCDMGSFNRPSAAHQANLPPASEAAHSTRHCRDQETLRFGKGGHLLLLVGRHRGPDDGEDEHPDVRRKRVLPDRRPLQRGNPLPHLQRACRGDRVQPVRLLRLATITSRVICLSHATARLPTPTLAADLSAQVPTEITTRSCVDLGT